MDLNSMGENAKKASQNLLNISCKEKKACLLNIKESLIDNVNFILNANKMDLENFNGNEKLKDRLLLNEERIKNMANSILEITKLPDPIFKILKTFDRPNHLKIKKICVPIGVIGIIYESRPNVTVDSAALCFKTSNSVILRGGKEAINTNKALVEIIKKHLPENSVQLITDNSREIVEKFVKLKYLNLLIPRGGEKLISFVRENATVPIIETGTGNCHIFVDKTADFNMAEKIIINAKCSRPSVCNACEKILIHKEIADLFLPKIKDSLEKNGVEIVDNPNWFEEYLSLKIAIKIVDNVDKAIEHINKYSSKHSDCIITKDKDNAKKFLLQVDSACVYLNSSTRFSDGYEFGFGAEIGISTQKLHARGPMGLLELTSYKYLIEGNGQTR